MPREKTPTTRQQEPIDRFRYIIIIAEGEKKEPDYFNELKRFVKKQLTDSRI
ncbi:RloB domain-containing protein [Thioflexithrix psekupsensis]|uniref:RloB domain-containing protein n=1 Tax=Thioflexithrix psekupsensis TaxID=1570016 RepID=UPI00111D1DD9|nr:RloB domain-containing protein [Thioflexithrix psekupsensis]